MAALPDSPFLPSVNATPPGGRVACASPSPSPSASPPAGEKDLVGPDALDEPFRRIAADLEGTRPDVLLLLGDQVYADEISDATQRR